MGVRTDKLFYKKEEVGFEKHYNERDITQEWATDFYSYFDSEENKTRYTPLINFLSDRFETPKILDLGCGSATLVPFLYQYFTDFRYIGVDHNLDAINYSISRFPKEEFLHTSCLEALNHHGFDCVVLSGMLFNSIDYHSLEKLSDLECLEKGLKALTKSGVLGIIVPFIFSDNPNFSLIPQAQWKLNSIDRLLDHINAKQIFQNMSVQIGLCEFIERQETKPDWWIPRQEAHQADRWKGSHMGTWTIILENI